MSETDYNIDTMWETILDKIKASILAYWSQVTWFVIGCVLGVVLLGGLVSCVSLEASANKDQECEACEDCEVAAPARPSQRPAKAGRKTPKKGQ